MITLTLTLTQGDEDAARPSPRVRSRAIYWSDLSGLDRGTKSRILYEEVQRLEGSLGESVPPAAEEPIAPTAPTPASDSHTTSGRGHPIEPTPATPEQNLEPVPALGSSPAGKVSSCGFRHHLNMRYK